MNPQNGRIVAKLEQLRAADPQCLFFGVDIHRYRLAPPLSAGDLKAIENHYGIALPADYASFLMEIGNGGAGPGYGLQRFGFVRSVGELPRAEPKGPLLVVQKTRLCTKSRQDLFDAAGQKVDPFDVSLFNSIKHLADNPGILKQPFPLTEPFRDIGHTPSEKLNPFNGVFVVADYGCGMKACLVLNGPFRGNVWLSDPNTDCFVPFNEMAALHYVDADKVKEVDVGATFTFAHWYEHWIDHALTQVSREYEGA